MSKYVKTDASESDTWIWGAAAIGEVIGRTPAQVYYLHGRGLLGDAVFKLSHKILVGDRRKLRNLQALATSET
jgi:hypothetical protein